MSHLPLPQTPEEVASSAMVLLGMRPLQSFSEIGRDEVTAASALYELMVSDLSEAHRWKFCTGQQLLEVDVAPPLDRYETAFHLPAFEQGTPYFIHTCRSGDAVQKYEIMGERIYCDIGSDQGLVAEYSYRVAEAFWPPSFKMCAVFKLAAMLAAAVTRNANQMKSMEGAYELQLMRAKGRDAQSVTPKKVRQRRFLTNRIMPGPVNWKWELMLRTLQTNLTGGAISSDAKDRLDLQVWRNSVRRAENVSIKPQGGATRRHGAAIVDELTDNTDYMVEAFTFSQNQSYVCLFSAGRVDFYDRVTRLHVYALTTPAMPWTAGMIANRELVIVQSFDTMFVFHKDFETRQIVRTSATTFYASTIQWGFLDTGTGSMPRMPMQKFISGYSTVFAGALTGTTTCVSNVPVFAAGHVGTWMLIYQVQCYINSVTDSQNINITINGTLPAPAATVDWQEQAFSPVRGWARCATLHEQRLFIGGGRDTPNTIWGSTTYDPLNFWLGTGQPTDGIKFIAAQDRVAEIKRMVSFRHLQVYTADGEFYAPSPQNGALMPSNFSLRQQSAYGIANADAKRFDQTSIFISRTANSIREFVYDDVQQSYSSDALTFMAKDYIRAPVELDVAIETETAQEALAVVTNGDGSLAILAKVRRENVGGWMLWTMAGLFKSVGVIEREIWAVVQHGGPAERWLCVFDRNYRLDFAKKLAAGSPATSWGPFPDHVGMTVDAISGDLYLGQYTVDGAGFIVVDTPISEIEIGHSYIPLIQPLVQEVQMPDGISWGLTKRLVSVTIQLNETLSAQVNQDHIPTSNAVEDPSVAPDRFTGKFQSWLLGVGPEEAPVITAPLPLAFNLTTIQTEVEV